MLARALCIAGLMGFIGYAAWTDRKLPPRVGSEVLGSGDSLADLVSGTYDRPAEKRRKAKPELAVRKSGNTSTKVAGCGKAGDACKSRRPKMRDLAGGYRTLCVRLCDGYYYPISAAAQPAEFTRDEDLCQASCATPAKLFVYRNRSGAPDTMTSIDGMPYASLMTAFQYRVSYDPSCACTASPWTEASANRHRLYALEQSVASGSLSGDIERRLLAAVVRAQEAEARERTGADLVVASLEPSPEASSGKKSATARKAGNAVKRKAAKTKQQRRVTAVRVTQLKAAPVRVVRASASRAQRRQVQMVRHARPIRVSEARGLVRFAR